MCKKKKEWSAQKLLASEGNRGILTRRSTCYYLDVLNIYAANVESGWRGWGKSEGEKKYIDGREKKKMYSIKIKHTLISKKKTKKKRVILQN